MICSQNLAQHLGPPTMRSVPSSKHWGSQIDDGSDFQTVFEHILEIENDRGVDPKLAKESSWINQKYGNPQSVCSEGNHISSPKCVSHSQLPTAEVRVSSLHIWASQAHGFQLWSDCQIEFLKKVSGKAPRLSGCSSSKTGNWQAKVRNRWSWQALFSLTT